MTLKQEGKSLVRQMYQLEESHLILQQNNLKSSRILARKVVKRVNHVLKGLLLGVVFKMNVKDLQKLLKRREQQKKH